MRTRGYIVAGLAVLGFVTLPTLYWPILLATIAGYVVLTQAVKMWLLRKAWL